MRCISSIGYRIRAAALAAGLAALPAFAEYKVPDFGREIFDMAGVIVGEDDRRETANALAALAANFRDDPAVGEELREMALAVALRMDPANRAALGAHRRLAEGTSPASVSGYAEPKPIAEQLWKSAAQFDDADASADERALRCYLLDIARRIDPDNATGHAEFQKAASRGPFPGWNGILGRETEDTFVFPAEGSGDTGTKPPTGDPPDPGSLKRTDASMKYPALARGEAGGTGSRIVGLVLNVDPGKPEAGQAIRVLYPSTVEGRKHPLSMTADTVVAALRGVHADWPANGSKVIARFDAPYTGADGRAGELSVALGLHFLYTGNPAPAGTAAMGGVEVDGAILPVPDILPRLTGLDTTACDTLIVPSANEADLLDLLVLGELTPLLRYQIFAVVTLKEALPLVEPRLAASLQKAYLDFAEVREVALKSSNPGDVLRTEAVRDRLRGILKIAPGHASAQLLLRFALGDLPPKLSRAGSRNALSGLIAAYRPFMEASGELLVTGDAERLRGNTATGLTAVRGKLDPALVPLADSLGDFALAFEEYGKVKFKGSQQGRALKDSVTEQWNALLVKAADPMAARTPEPKPEPGAKDGTKPKTAPIPRKIDFGLDDDPR